MFAYTVLVFGGIFSLIAIYINEENQIKDLLKSIVVFSIFFCVLKISRSIQSFDETPIYVAIILAIICYVIYLFKKNDL